MQRLITTAAAALARGAMILMAVTLAACDPPPQMLGGSRAKSPDGQWIADAVTMQFNRGDHSELRTTVYLAPAKDPNTKQTVLVFPNEISKEKGKIDVLLHWPDTGHLEVMLSRIPVFDTQIVRYAGIDISVRFAILGVQAPPSPDQIKAALSGTDLKNARLLLLDLHCNPKTAEQVAAVREAWHELGSTTSTEVTQDHLIQALLAQCLIEAQPQNAAPDPDTDSAILVLRSAVRSENINEALAGALGLIHYGDPHDNQGIIDITHREPKVTTFVSAALSYSCLPNAARTLQLMRDQAPDAATKDKIDASIQRAEPQRHEKCDASH
jgi:hypothetical protein